MEFENYSRELVTIYQSVRSQKWCASSIVCMLRDSKSQFISAMSSFTFYIITNLLAKGVELAPLIHCGPFLYWWVAKSSFFTYRVSSFYLLTGRPCTGLYSCLNRFSSRFLTKTKSRPAGQIVHEVWSVPEDGTSAMSASRQVW